MARMLIVDDQDMMRDSLAAILAREGHEVIAAADGQSALARLANSRIDLVISDMKMPKMGGLELLAEIKKTKPDMPVLLMTAYGTVQNAVDAMKLGAFDFLQKPFEAEAVKLLVDRMLEQSRIVRENAAYRSMTEISGPKPLVGNGPAMAEIRK